MPLHLMATLQGPTKTLSDPSEFQTLLAVTNAHISLHRILTFEFLNETLNRKFTFLTFFISFLPPSFQLPYKLWATNMCKNVLMTQFQIKHGILQLPRKH